MAVSGNQLTRIGGYLSGVGKKLTVLAKEVTSIFSGYKVYNANINTAYNANIDTAAEANINTTYIADLEK